MCPPVVIRLGFYGVLVLVLVLSYEYIVQDARLVNRDTGLRPVVLRPPMIIVTLLIRRKKRPHKLSMNRVIWKVPLPSLSRPSTSTSTSTLPSLSSLSSLPYPKGSARSSTSIHM